MGGTPARVLAVMTVMLAAVGSYPLEGRSPGASRDGRKAPHAGVSRFVPNDPFFGRQFTFSNAGGDVRFPGSSRKAALVTRRISPGIHHDLPRAWSVTRGSKRVVIAILDDGFFYDHEDIRDNLWHNPGESGLDADGIPKSMNGKDDDGNGYVDDVVGWDFAFNDPDPDRYIFDGRLTDRIQPYTHSTPALGIIGARGNNRIGVAGINWQVSMMLLKIGAQGGTPPDARTQRAAQAIRYAADNGARVINWSGFVRVTDPDVLKPLRDAIAYAESKDVLLVVAAGNDYYDLDLPENVVYPACFDADNLIVVGENDFAGNLYKVPEGSQFVGGSNYGLRRVHVTALAEHYSTQEYQNQPVYGLTGGTSNAAPVVTGIAGLMLSVKGTLRAQDLKALLMKTVKPLPALRGRVASGGMVDAWAAVVAARDDPKHPR